MRPSTEDGFVLISAMWMLLLAAAIAALLTLRALTASRDYRIDADRFAGDHAQADAIETIAADLVFAGPASHWSQLPGSGTLLLDGRSIAAATDSEDRYLDANKADPKLIDAALHDHGYAADVRLALLGRIMMARSRHRIASYAELASLAQSVVPSGQEDCLLDVVSPFGGNGTPSPTSTARAGNVVRVSFGRGPHRRLQTLRLVAANDRPYALLDDYEASCPVGAGT